MEWIQGTQYEGVKFLKLFCQEKQFKQFKRYLLYDLSFTDQLATSKKVLHNDCLSLPRDILLKRLKERAHL